jgi:mitochondrial distribution and morphology protein 34
MFLRLSSFQLSGIIILVFSKQKGLTLVFRNDPVDSVNVSSTFDSIPAIQRFLQAEIERLLRDLMREEVPAIIHKLSLEWAMRHQADECLSPASLTNTQPDNETSLQNYPYSLDLDANDSLRPIFSAINLNRLSELSLAQHTLSPFTASIPQSVFRSSTSIIASLRYGAVRRRDFPITKSSESEPLFPRTLYISPPESVSSAQSADVSIRPSLHGRRQRSSYLRRSHPPKRKIVRLQHPGTQSTSDAPSLAQSDVASEGGDYFSEPGGYQTMFHPDYQGRWDGKDAALHDDLWVNRFPRSWDGIPKEPEKMGDNPWTGDRRYPLPIVNEK